MRKVLIFTSLALCLAGCKSSSDIKSDLRSDISTLKTRIQRGRPDAEAVAVEMMECSLSTMTNTFSYVGSAQAAHNTTISTSYPGTVTSLRVRPGAKIHEGDIVAVVSSASVESSYDMAKSTLDRAQDGYDRVLKAYKTGAISEVKKVEVESQLRSAEASFRAASEARENLTVRAVHSGVVDKVYVVEGQRVTLSEPLISLVDTDVVELHIALPESEYPLVNVGAKANVHIPTLGLDTQAVLTSKGVVASLAAHTYDCTLALTSKVQGLVPGMVCKVSMTSENGSGIVIPASAVLTDAAGRYVWAVENECAVRKYITVGGYSADGIIVSSGLEPHDVVIVKGSRKVSTGMKVKSWH